MSILENVSGAIADSVIKFYIDPDLAAQAAIDALGVIILPVDEKPIVGDTVLVEIGSVKGAEYHTWVVTADMLDKITGILTYSWVKTTIIKRGNLLVRQEQANETT